MFRSSASVISTSTSPVGFLASSVPSTLFLTTPFICTQDSRVNVFMTASNFAASAPAGRSSGSKTT